MYAVLMSLPPELEDKDFRVIAPPGGYLEHLNDVLIEGAEGFTVYASRDSVPILVEVYVNRSEIAMAGPEVHFEHCAGQILGIDGQPTRQMLDIFLVIDLDVTRKGATAGSLRMTNLPIPYPNEVEK